MTIPVSFEHYQRLHKTKKPIPIHHYLNWYEGFRSGEKVAYVPTRATSQSLRHQRTQWEAPQWYVDMLARWDFDITTQALERRRQQ